MASLGPPPVPLKLNALDPLEAGELIFSISSGDSTMEVLRFKSNGDIYVKGKLTENDKEVVEALRVFLKIGDPKSINEGRLTRFERIDDT